MKRLIIPTLLALLVVGCSSTPDTAEQTGAPVDSRGANDGKILAFITRRESGFRLAVMDLASRQVQILTDSFKDESPSFAPNSRMILIATETGGRGVLAAVSVDGRNKQRLSIPASDVREPAWGPYLR